MQKTGEPVRAPRLPPSYGSAVPESCCTSAGRAPCWAGALCTPNQPCSSMMKSNTELMSGSSFHLLFQQLVGSPQFPHTRGIRQKFGIVLSEVLALLFQQPAESPLNPHICAFRQET
jgi:hypothetical protein